jgi:DNA-binding protein HU-beta
MTKAEIVSIVASRTGLPKQDVEASVDGFMQVIIETMKNGERIEIRGFGAFTIRKKNKRIAQNPRTGEKLIIEEKIVPAFKISKEFKAAVVDKFKRNARKRFETFE